MTLVIERDDAKRSGDIRKPPAITRDLRDVLAGRARWSWRSIVCPSWLRGSWATLLVIAISLLAMQAFMIAMGLFLTRLEAANDVGMLPEKLLIFGFASSTAAWSVLAMEVAAACYRDGGKLVTFAFRPVSPWDLWLDIQRDGLAFVPTQILYSLPFIAILALFSRDYVLHGAAVVGIALLACMAMRSLLIAGTCITSVVTKLRFWIRFPLQWITAFGGSVIILLTIGQAVAVPGEGAVLSVVIRQLVLNVVALVALAVATMAWHAGAEPIRKPLH